jgi:hypothetical protein
VYVSLESFTEQKIMGEEGYNEEILLPVCSSGDPSSCPIRAAVPSRTTFRIRIRIDATHEDQYFAFRRDSHTLNPRV